MREPKPVTRVEVSEKHRKLRIVAAVVLLIIGALAITSGIMSLIGKDTGWQTVEVAVKDRSCAGNFLLQYNFTGSGAEATALNRKLEDAYGNACVKAYQLFTPDEEIAGVNNIYVINRHPNEILTVDPVLYQAFSLLKDQPYLYLGPVYHHYYGAIFSSNEVSVGDMDPLTNPEMKAYVETLSRYAANREHIRLELLENHQICLHVSQEYLDFARNEGIENFLDFSYMTNAFVIDYLADTLAAEGLTRGYLVSVDGFTRNLDKENRFGFNIYDRVGNLVYPAGALEYQGPASIVYLKNYPTAASDTNYRAAGDHYIHLLVDPADGIYRTADENLVSYSYELGCAQVLLKMLPCFLGAGLEIPEGVYSIWCEDAQVLYNDPAAVIGNLLEDEGIRYTAKLQK